MNSRISMELEMTEDGTYLRTILQTTADGLWIIDIAGKIVEINEAYCRLSGYTRSELLKMSIADLDADKTTDEIEANIKSIVAAGSGMFERRHRKKDGTVFDIELSVSYINAKGGQLVCFCRDVSERKRNEAALLESARQLKQAHEIARLGRWELDLPTGHLLWSDGIYDLFEISRQTFRASYDAFLDFIHPDDRVRVNQAYRESVEHKKAYEIEHRLLMKDGRIKWVNEIGRTTYDELGHPVRSIGTVQDITERKQVENERKIVLELLRLLNQNNQLHVLMEQVAELIRDWSGCDAVGIRLQEGADFPYFETRGFPADFVMKENSLCALDTKGEWIRDDQGNPVLECMCGNVICGRFDPAQPFFTANGSFWTNSTTDLLSATSAADRLARTRNRCNGEGYESVALIPLRHGDKNLGLLQCNDVRRDRFNASKIHLLEQLAANLTIGLVQRRTATALAKNEEKYRSLMDQSVSMLYLHDLEGNILEVNLAAVDGTGYTKKELSQMTVFDLHADPSDRDNTLLQWRGLQVGNPLNIIALQRRKDGTAFPVEIKSGKIQMEQGQYILTLVHDITKRKRDEAKLRDQNEFIWTILDNLPIGLAVNKLAEGTATYINNQFEKVYGWPKKELENIQSFFEKVYPDPKYRKKIQTRIQDDIASGDPERMHWKNIEITAKDGSKRIISAKNIRLVEQNVMISIAQDETRRIRSEEESKKFQSQLNQAQKMESVGRLAGGVAHDFNNMLSVILGYTEMAMEKVQPNDPLLADLGEIFNAATRSADITRQLLAFARKQTIAPKVIDLNTIVESMLRMLRPLIGEDIDLAWHPGKQLWPVEIDPAQVDQVLANLCVNARDAISGVGQVTIETTNIAFDEAYCELHAGFSPGQFVLLAVSDDGCGMDKEILNHIFEPFFTTKEVTQGTGLGLAMIYGIVKQNNGFINVYSEPAKGTTFRIYLPRHAEAKQSFRPEGKTQIPSSRGEMVLLVEDEPAILRMGKIMLNRLGYQVLAAGTPRIALEIAQEHIGDIKLLITDVVMPDMNGRELANQLSNLYPGLKTLYMSGYTANVIAHRGVLEEGMDFIQKPFSVSDLGVKVRKALDQL